jgi:hypothetical protein
MFDDRSWFDETYVFLESMGISFLQPWPASFTHAALDLSPRLGTVLDHLANEDAYPPLIHVITWSFRSAPNPLLAARAVFVICGLVLIGVVFRGGLRLGGPGTAALLTAAVACSPMLTSTGQELKWYALAPLLATAATLLLLDLGAEDRRRWALYALCLVPSRRPRHFQRSDPPIARSRWRRPPARLLPPRGGPGLPHGWYGPGSNARVLAFRRSCRLIQLGYQPTTVTTVAASWLYTPLVMIGRCPFASPFR